MINIVMLVHNRPRLTEQALRTLMDSYVGRHHHCYLTIVDDASDDETTLKLLDQWSRSGSNVQVVRNEVALGVGGSRNRGVRESEAKWGRFPFLMLCDNDAAFVDAQWSVILTSVLERFPEVAIVSGYCHPYSQANRSLGWVNGHEVVTHDALGGLHWFMRWSTWERFGTLLDNARGTCASEDWEYCQRVRSSGYEVASVRPWAVWNAGKTNSFGQPSPGWEVASPPLEGVIIE